MMRPRFGKPLCNVIEIHAHGCITARGRVIPIHLVGSDVVRARLARSRRLSMDCGPEAEHSKQTGDCKKNARGISLIHFSSGLGCANFRTVNSIITESDSGFEAKNASYHGFPFWHPEPQQHRPTGSLGSSAAGSGESIQLRGHSQEKSEATLPSPVKSSSRNVAHCTLRLLVLTQIPVLKQDETLCAV